MSMIMNYVNLSYYHFRYVRYLSDICRYIWYLPISFRYRTYLNFRFVYQSNFASKCSISLICPDIAIRSRSSRSDWLHHQIYIRRTHEHEKFEASYTKSPFGAKKRFEHLKEKFEHLKEDFKHFWAFEKRVWAFERNIWAFEKKFEHLKEKFEHLK